MSFPRRWRPSLTRWARAWRMIGRGKTELPAILHQTWLIRSSGSPLERKLMLDSLMSLWANKPDFPRHARNNETCLIIFVTALMTCHRNKLMSTWGRPSFERCAEGLVIIICLLLSSWACALFCSWKRHRRPWHVNTGMIDKASNDKTYKDASWSQSRIDRRLIIKKMLMLAWQGDIMLFAAHALCLPDSSKICFIMLSQWKHRSALVFLSSLPGEAMMALPSLRNNCWPEASGVAHLPGRACAASHGWWVMIKLRCQ